MRLIVNNPFVALANRQMTAPSRARMRAAQKRALAKVTDDRRVLNKVWRQWRAERRAAILNGPFGDAALELIGFLDTVAVADTAMIVGMIEAGPWRQADADTRFEILSLADAALVSLRERNKLPPFDDLLPGPPRDAFLQIRELLR
jgi:hypothetical protein